MPVPISQNEVFQIASSRGWVAAFAVYLLIFACIGFILFLNFLTEFSHIGVQLLITFLLATLAIVSAVYFFKFNKSISRAAQSKDSQLLETALGQLSLAWTWIAISSIIYAILAAIMLILA